MSEPLDLGMGPGGPAPAPAPAPSAAPGKTFKSTPEDRARWRRKYQLARAKRLAAAGTPGAAEEVERIKRDLVPAGAGSSGVAPDAGPAPDGPVAAPLGPVPWDPGVLSPLFQAVIPEVEKLDVASLRAKAAAIDTSLAVKVEKDAAWNPVAKATLTTTGPQVVAQALNSAGISAEHAPAIALVTAVASIFAGRTILARKLEEMASRPRNGTESTAVPPVEASHAE